VSSVLYLLYIATSFQRRKQKKSENKEFYRGFNSIERKKGVLRQKSQTPFLIQNPKMEIPTINSSKTQLLSFITFSFKRNTRKNNKKQYYIEEIKGETIMAFPSNSVHIEK